jgi:hypothetical protein
VIAASDQSMMPVSVPSTSRMCSAPRSAWAITRSWDGRVRVACTMRTRSGGRRGHRATRRARRPHWGLRLRPLPDRWHAGRQGTVPAVGRRRQVESGRATAGRGAAHSSVHRRPRQRSGAGGSGSTRGWRPPRGGAPRARRCGRRRSAVRARPGVDRVVEAAAKLDDGRKATEDIDLTWKLLLDGWQTAYEPRAPVGMQVPADLGMAGQPLRAGEVGDPSRKRWRPGKPQRPPPQARGRRLAGLLLSGCSRCVRLQVLIAPGLVSAQITHTASAIPTIDQSG